MKIRNSKNTPLRSSRKQNISLKISLVLAAVITTGTAYAFVGANVGAISTEMLIFSKNLVAQMQGESANTIRHQTNAINNFSRTTVQNITDNTNTMLGNIKIATAQNAQSAQALAEVQTQTSHKLATSRQIMHIQDQVIRATRKYGATGQGYNACAVLVKNQGLDEAADKTKIIAAAKETETLSSISAKTDLNAFITNKIKLGESEFCASGNPHCTPSDLPGANVNGAILFAPASEGSKEQLARSEFRSNVLGVNVQALTGRANVESPSGQEAFFKSNRMSALLSPAAYSLAYIDAQNTRTIERNGKMYTANELIEDTISRYYGGPEAKDWQASMIIQEPRGLLVEAAKLSGVNVWLTNHMYSQNLRKEANLASILLTTASPLSEDVRDLSNQADARAIRSAIKIYD